MFPFHFPFLFGPEPETSELRFKNFGVFGYALARVLKTTSTKNDDGSSPGSSESFEWFALHAPQAPAPLRESARPQPVHTWLTNHKNVFDIQLEQAQSALYLLQSGGISCLAAERQRKALPKGFDCSWVAPRVQVSATVCEPKGPHRSNEIEVFSAENSGTCLFQQQNFDERAPQADKKSALICAHPSKRLLQTQLPDAAQFVFPSQKKDFFHFYEGKYSPAKISTLNLADLSWRPNPRASVGLIPQTKPSGSALAIPTSASGLYECRSPQSLTGSQWFLVEHDVFVGQRRIASDTEQVWRVSETADLHLQVERLAWKNAIKNVPELDAFPGWSCLDSPALDVKCGIRVLQTTGQLALETLAGASDSTLSPAVQWNVFLAGYLALRRVNQELPEWQLKRETALLANFFRAQLNGLLAGGQGSATSLSLLAPLEVPALLMPSSEPEESLQDLLSLPANLWQKLQPT